MPILVARRILLLYLIAVRNVFGSHKGQGTNRVRLSRPLRLRYFFEDCGGVLLKFGQILAMRFDILPIPYALALCDLFDNASPLPNEAMFRVFSDETGEDINKHFLGSCAPCGLMTF